MIEQVVPYFISMRISLVCWDMRLQSILVSFGLSLWDRVTIDNLI